MKGCMESNFRQRLLSGEPTSVINSFYQLTSLKQSVASEEGGDLLCLLSGMQLEPREQRRRRSWKLLLSVI